MKKSSMMSLNLVAQFFLVLFLVLNAGLIQGT